jgi:cytoskeletal protein RodZ
MQQKLASNGFSIVGVLVALVVVAAVGLGGFFVWQKNKEDEPTGKSNNKTSQNEQKNENNEEEENETPDPYEGWQTHSNATYGISFKYPAGWKTEEVAGSSSPGNYPITIEYAINVKRNEDVKYNNTVAVEVLHQSLDEAVVEYDKQFAQAPSNPVTKTTNQLKGKQSVQYAFSNSETGQRLYLFAVGGKTYSFRSINEELNVQADPDYWAKFGKVFESLQISAS